VSEIDKVIACNIEGVDQTPDANLVLNPFDTIEALEVFDWNCDETLDQNSTRLMAKIVDAQAGAVLLAGNNRNQHILLLALGLLRTGIDVWICIDAVQSETQLEHTALIGRLQHSGALCLTHAQLRAERASMLPLLKALNLSTSEATDREEPNT